MYSINGHLTETKPTIAVTDFGFARGITVFELFRVYAGNPFYLEAHLNRLENGAQQLGITIPVSRATIIAHIHQLIQTHRYPHSAVKLYLTAGTPSTSSGLSFAACSGFSPQLFIMEDEVKPQHPEAPYGLHAYQRGQRLKTVLHIRELPTIKTANYGIGFYAARQVAGPDYDDILFTTPQGHVTEATRSNFFAVINNTLVTPQTGMLEGITRSIVLQLAKSLNIPTRITTLTPEDLTHATEAFTTGSIAELVPACSINQNLLKYTTNGPIFQQLRQAFTAEIKRCTAGTHLQSVA